MRNQIVVRLSVEGFHRWPGAYASCSFLADRHRHQFHIEAHKRVEGVDREIEFISFGRGIREWIRINHGEPAEFGTLSCEEIAQELILAFGLVSCSVFEDNENGAFVEA